MKTETGLFANMKIAYGSKEVDPGRRIRFCRHMRELECKELAIKAGISPSYLSSIERNRTKAPVKTYDAIAKALHLTLNELFGVTAINWNK
jgi:transcriptional regulator with XRE-family HTH domain